MRSPEFRLSDSPEQNISQKLGSVQPHHPSAWEMTRANAMVSLQGLRDSLKRVSPNKVARTVGAGIAVIPSVAAIVEIMPSSAAADQNTVVLNGDQSWPGGEFQIEAAGHNGGGVKGFTIQDDSKQDPQYVGEFESAYQQYGGASSIGFVNSSRFKIDGIVYQGTQDDLLQANPNLHQVVEANISEIFTAKGFDDILDSKYGIPKPFTGDDGSNGDFQKAVQIRTEWLKSDPNIERFYYANPNPSKNPNWNKDMAIQVHGLPVSRVIDKGPFRVVRLQRGAIIEWTQQVPGGQPVGTIQYANLGDIAKELGLIPKDAQIPTPFGVGTGSGLNLPEYVPAPAPTPEAQNPAGPPAGGKVWAEASDPNRQARSQNILNQISFVPITTHTSSLGEQYIEATGQLKKTEITSNGNIVIWLCTDKAFLNAPLDPNNPSTGQRIEINLQESNAEAGFFSSIAAPQEYYQNNNPNLILNGIKYYVGGIGVDNSPPLTLIYTLSLPASNHLKAMFMFF